MRPLSTVLLAFLLIGCTAANGSPTASPQLGSLSPSIDPSPRTSAASAEPSPSAEPTPSQPAAVMEVGSWVATTADRLKLRDAPGLAAGSMGLLAVGSSGTVIEGPVDLDGYRWYRLAWAGLPFGSGCATGPIGGFLNCWNDGWLAGANADGDPWLRATEPPCPEEPETVGDLAVTQPGLRLACSGDRDLTVVGYIPTEIAPRGCYLGYEIVPSWLDPCAISYVQGAETAEGTGPELGLNMHPDLGRCDYGGRTPPSCPFAPFVGQWVEVVGHFDDPAAETCTVNPMEGNDQAPDDPLGRYMCRERFVVTSVGPGTAP